MSAEDLRRGSAVVSQRGSAWPATIEHRGALWHSTGKYGTHIATWRPTLEYEHKGARLWAFVDCTVATENA